MDAHLVRIPHGRFTRLAIAAIAVLIATPFSTRAQSSGIHELDGLWVAKLRFGPDIRGTLLIQHEKEGWRADIAGLNARATIEQDVITFELPDGGGGFRGRLASSRQRIVGHWIQGPTNYSGFRYASPITLERIGKSERWQGLTDPFNDQFTMYLKVEVADDGSTRAFLKNPERNIGRFIRVDTIERDGQTVRLRAKRTQDKEGEVLSQGTFIDGVLSLPLRGGTYDFARVPTEAASDFYARSRPAAGASYRYSVPPSRDDGWQVATPEDVGVSRPGLETLVRTIIDTPIDSLNSPEIHGVLIARHGKLILDEYFHGEYRDKPHETRSAAKSVCAVLAGAAIQSNVRLSADSHVYEIMHGGTFPDGLEPRKRALTLEHLLTMSSGFNCDDNDPENPGNEDRINEQRDEPDFWKLTLALEMIRDPGESATYCSIQPNLAGGVIRNAAGRPLPELFHDVVAEPMQIRRYWMNLMPSGEAYMGGGMTFLLRDFAKFGQLMLDDGRWGKHRVISEAWARRSSSPLVSIGNRKYGYLWWLTEYPYQGKQVGGFYASGNGGQIIMVIRELDLVIAFFAGNYADRAALFSMRRLIPEYVLPAVIAK
jgi:CubicO group peptidase (beta-lactamase class C family)